MMQHAARSTPDPKSTPGVPRRPALLAFDSSESEEVGDAEHDAGRVGAATDDGGVGHAAFVKVVVLRILFVGDSRPGQIQVGPLGQVEDAAHLVVLGAGIAAGRKREAVGAVLVL